MIQKYFVLVFIWMVFLNISKNFMDLINDRSIFRSQFLRAAARKIFLHTYEALWLRNIRFFSQYSSLKFVEMFSSLLL